MKQERDENHEQLLRSQLNMKQITKCTRNVERRPAICRTQGFGVEDEASCTRNCVRTQKAEPLTKRNSLLQLRSYDLRGCLTFQGFKFWEFGECSFGFVAAV